MKSFFTTVILFLFSLGVFSQGNPFITHMYTADPSAHVWADGRIYVYASHDIAPPRGCDLMDEYHVFSSDDMVKWTDHGEILRASQVPWGKPLKDNAKFMWAPDCVFKNGTYYFYFPHPSEDPWGKNWKIGVATSTKPASDFKVIGYIPNIEPLIDPCVFVDDDGQAYFYHGGGGTCKAGKLKDNMMEIDGEMKVMEGLEDFHEATWIHKRNGVYYLSYSDNHENGKEGVKGNNRMRYATSNKPLGPWKYQGIYMDPTDSYTNHGSIVEYKGQWYSFYHNSKLSARNGEPNDWLRSICVDKLFYNDDGSIKKVIQTNPVTSSFKGEKTSWHGFDRYDYVIDEQTLQLSPRKNEEGNGVAGPKPGTRHCVVVVPKQAAPGNPWTWRGCYWDHAPQAEIELLKRGFHVAYITTDPDETWDIWYKFLLKEYGLSPKPAFIGMSRGGANSFTWGTSHPENVTAICADNPGLSQTSLMKMDLLAANNVPILNICGSVDPILFNTYGIQGVYHGNGGRMSVIIKDGPAHHPHSLSNPAIIADFIEQSFNEEEAPKPAFLPDMYKKSAFYSTKPQYEYAESEKLWLTKWGPYFTGSYNKYSFSLRDVEGSVTVIAPTKAAPGNPWIFRCDQPDGNSAVDLELLAKGFHVVVGPVPYNFDGPKPEHWNIVYTWLVKHGFSPKPVLAGRGAATGEVYAWAIENPDKVSSIYGENPILRSSLAKVQPIDNLAPLAKAKIPIIHACGSLDPNLNKQTNEVKKRYGGKITVIIDQGRGHFPLEPNDAGKVAELIVQTTKREKINSTK